MTTPNDEIEVYRTDIFDAWLGGLRDHKAVAKITTRIDRLQLGNPGDAEPVGGGVSEMRIDYGPGYRVYFIRRGNVVVILLCGGDKSSQKSDIKIAKALAAEIKDASHG
ncbi:type II toxin-antitoxin system RelE/ParE family toxin [Devosia honganensis]|uniref:Type II toxin-antitoxin system RelE/ParE family toxin n=1 Tax=Devosia honganensis TaxID=1610527 RepID=A0ABV7X5A2_9HYPH